MSSKPAETPDAMMNVLLDSFIASSWWGLIQEMLRRFHQGINAVCYAELDFLIRNWFLGGAATTEPSTEKIHLDFLDIGQLDVRRAGHYPEKPLEEDAQARYPSG